MMKPLSLLPLPNPPPEGEGTNEPLREFVIDELAGLPALWCSKPGQVRKEAAIAITASAGVKARLLFCNICYSHLYLVRVKKWSQ